jgi:hypothetical protein
MRLILYLNFCKLSLVLQIGYIKKGINPLSTGSLLLSSKHTALAAKTGIITGLLSLAVIYISLQFLSATRSSFVSFSTHTNYKYRACQYN